MIDAFGERDAGGLGGLLERPAQFRIISIHRRHKAAIIRKPDQRVDARQINVIGDQRKRSGGHFFEKRACRIGEDQPRDTKRRHRLNRRAHDRSITLLVIMGAALHDEHARFADMARNQAG